MIIALEGISAAGKTTWCRNHAALTVAELPAISPPAGEVLAVAKFWADANCRRWAEAERIEAESGKVYCDTDPLKLHYTWSLWRVGHATKEDWRTAVATHRAAIESRRLGFADAVVFLEPDQSIVQRQKELDATRQRRNFDLHLKIGTALREWYEIIDRFSPGRLIWRGERVGDVATKDNRAERFSVELFDAIIDEAGRRGG